MSLKSFNKTDPHFCIIAPTAYLEEYATQSATHLALAHLVDTDDQYANFYHEMSDRGDRVIIDNGAYELGESYEPSKLVELGHKCGADAIVLPDYPFKDTSVTINAAKELLPTIKGEGFKSFFVPQSETGDLENWILGYQWAAEHPDIDIIGMSILGIPNAIPHIPKAYARVVLTEILLDRGIFNHDKFHHYLGLNSTPNVEIPPLILMNALDSCDSSNPVWTALQGFKYNEIGDSFLPIQKKYLREVDFSTPMTHKSSTHAIIQHNLDVTFDVFNNPSAYL